MDPEKIDEKRSEHSPDTRIDNLNYENSSSQAAIEQQKSASQPSGILGTFSKLGNLPEWHVPGFGLLQGKALNNAISWCSCLAFLMFGYDQGVLSGVLTLDDFQRHFPLMTPRDRPNNLCWLDAPTNTIPDPNMCTGSPSILSACVAVYQIGCFLGAVLILFYGETWGRKSSSFWGSFIMIVGTIIQVAAGGTSGGGVDGYALLSIGRVVGGIGNGMVTASEYCIHNDVLPSAKHVCSNSHVAVRVCETREAWTFDHHFGSSHRRRSYDILLGHLWLLFPPIRRVLLVCTLEVSHRIPVIFHSPRHVRNSPIPDHCALDTNSIQDRPLFPTRLATMACNARSPRRSSTPTRSPCRCTSRLGGSRHGTHEHQGCA